MSLVEHTGADGGRLVTIVEAQRRTGVPGPELMRAVVAGEFPSVPGPYGLELVDLVLVEAGSRP